MSATTKTLTDLLAQYKSYLEDMRSIGTRHENTRKYYVTVVSALFVFLSMAGPEGVFHSVQGNIATLVGGSGILLCASWIIHMQAFGAIYAAKFGVLREMELDPRLFEIFKLEFVLLKADRRYVFLTLLDTLVPAIFGGLFAALMVMKIN